MRLVSKPVLCNYYVTYRCNAACGFCDIWEKPSPYITLEQAQQNFTDLKRLGVKIIDFTGGEPLLHPHIHELLALAKSMGFITTLTTNGLLYPKKAESIKGLVDMLHFSLDSSLKEEHDAWRKVACFDFVMESIQIAKQLGERPDILFTVFPYNLAQIQKVYEKICLPHQLVLLLNPAFEYQDINKAQALSTTELKELRAWSKKPMVYLNEAFIDLREDGGNHINDPVCLAASSTVVISPENELIVPCYHLGEKKFPIQNNLYQLFHSTEVKKLQALEGRMNACQGCTINCYMQPSFAVNINRYWWKSFKSTMKYNYLKGTWKQLF